MQREGNTFSRSIYFLVQQEQQVKQDGMKIVYAGFAWAKTYNIYEVYRE